MCSFPTKPPGLKARAMIISDDPETARVWSYCISIAGAEAVVVEFTDRIMQLWADEVPDLIIVESISRKNDELELCRKLRIETPVPILLIPSGDDESQLHQAYTAGVDECITPPVSPRLFISKIRSWLRRTQMVPSAALGEAQSGCFCLDAGRRALVIDGSSPVRLTNLETRLLYLLLTYSNRVLESDFLIERVWGQYGDGDTVLLKNLVYRLRRKIEPDPGEPRYLVTEASGYRFVPSL